VHVSNRKTHIIKSQANQWWVKGERQNEK